MKSYLDLIPVSAKVHRKQTRLVRFCIVLSVFLIAAIFGMADMHIKGMLIQTTLSDGAWHVVFGGLDDRQAALVAARPEVAAYSRYAVMNYNLDMDYKINGINVGICGSDESFLKLYPAVSITEGEFPSPQKERTVLISENMKKQLALSIGDDFAITTPEGSLSFCVCGFLNDTAYLAQTGAYCIYMDIGTYMECFQEVTKEEDIAFYVQFAAGCNIQRAVRDICGQLGIGQEQVGQNAKLLGLMLQSDDHYILMLYMVAAVLALLVAVSGMMMILASMNSNVAQRTEFFGMMRCLGATGKQVKRFVRTEALSWCKTAVPAGLALSIIAVWVLCGLLRALSPVYFGELPVFGISPAGLISGAVIGVLTVLAAANAPAKRAAKVSALTAVSGNADTVFEVKRAANTRFFHVETVLGMHHAAGSKKNLFLLSGSFALSIILFLGFSTLVDFMRHAIVPLRPYTPDVSVASQDNTCSIPRDLLETLEKEPFVKRVFARGFAYDMEAAVNGETVRVNLISYEKYQFMWAEDYFMAGDMDAVKDGRGIMTAYDAQRPLEIGDIMTVSTPDGGTRGVSVGALLNYVPFDREGDEISVICSEELFRQISGENGYTVIDIQLGDRSDEAVERIRGLAGMYGSHMFSDRRQSNSETRGVYYSIALLVYGFLLIVALIAAFNMVNSIAMSVSARMRQYGVMRAVGITVRQLGSMIVAETAVYLIWGLAAGFALGLPLHYILYRTMITVRWGTAWMIPAPESGIIAAVMFVSAVLSIAGPVKRIRRTAIL